MLLSFYTKLFFLGNFHLADEPRTEEAAAISEMDSPLGWDYPVPTPYLMTLVGSGAQASPARMPARNEFPGQRLLLDPRFPVYSILFTFPNRGNLFLHSS